MTLTLELSDATGARSSDATHVFGEEGGTIGRAATNAWVLPHNKVSGLHARITFTNGAFYIEDASRNGVCVNAPDNRLVRNRPYPLKSGDRLFIEPYEMTIWIDQGGAARAPAGDPFADDDPFRLTPAPSSSPLPGGAILPDRAESGEVDPLKFFDPVGAPAPRKRAELPSDDPGSLGQHYQPPVIMPSPGPPPKTPAAAPAIPAGYNPLADDPIEPIAPPIAPARPPSSAPLRPRPGDSAVWRRRRESGGSDPQRPPSGAVPVPPPVARREPAAPPAPPPADDLFSAPTDPASAPLPPPREVPPPVAAPVDPESTRPPIAPASKAPAAPPLPSEPPHAAAPVASPPPPRPRTPAAASRAPSDLADLLAGAGIPDAVVTPELTRNIGQILNVVVAGLMDVLQSRQRIKEEFRMQQTIFRQADNNPLKFSVNVEDALHNLLVKRNPAYLRPVEAFADAFDDLRDHQLAMLAGMRVAFDTMLADTDPDKMQEQFDSQLGKSSLALVPAKMRYWDLYRARRGELARDPEAAFERLFGEQFRKAYEEQFRQLKAQRHARGSRDGSDPGDERS
ncbi:MAG TPA: type VI secretion system-associated FHA domain protein TagH [Vicinamibacterales bacterium]